VGTNFWHVVNRPQDIHVLSPDINPNLVTLPDLGQLPGAHSGENAAWFGQKSTGTFCGSDFQPPTQDAKSGCTSTSPLEGELVSPPINLSSATSATLHFWSWFEIEAVDADRYDLMTVDVTTASSPSESDWQNLGKLNPASNPAGAHDQSYSNNGLEQSGSWKEYLVDLSQYVGTSKTVMVRFKFDTHDNLYQGFRGWFIDDVKVAVPYDVAKPSISSVDVCSGTSDAPVTVIHGANFVLGSRVLQDGQAVPKTSTPASDRIEIPAVPAGSHTLQVKAPNGDLSNVATVTGGACAPPPAPPSGPAPPLILKTVVITPLLTGGPLMSGPDGTIFDTEIVNQAGTVTDVANTATAGIARVRALAARAEAAKKGKGKKGCPKGTVKIKKSCLPPNSVYGSASATAGGAGSVTLAIHPSAKVKAALAKGKKVALTLNVSFQAAKGGAPVTNTRTLVVQGQKAKKGKGKKKK
jgi:hypothetical protein